LLAIPPRFDPPCALIREVPPRDSHSHAAAAAAATAAA